MATNLLFRGSERAMEYRMVEDWNTCLALRWPLLCLCIWWWKI